MIARPLLALIIFFALEPHAAPAVKKTVIVALGDSITEGYGIDKNKAYPQLVQTQLIKNGHTVEVINAGISGSTSASGASRIKWFIAKKPDILFIALGANDGMRGVKPEVTKRNLKETIRIAKKNKLRVWLAGMKMPPNYGEAFTKDFSKIFKEIALEENIPLLPFLLEGVAGVTKLNQTDGIHPNEQGQEVIAKNVAQFFKDNL